MLGVFKRKKKTVENHDSRHDRTVIRYFSSRKIGDLNLHSSVTWLWVRGTFPSYILMSIWIQITESKWTINKIPCSGVFGVPGYLLHNLAVSLSVSVWMSYSWLKLVPNCKSGSTSPSPSATNAATLPESTLTRLYSRLEGINPSEILEAEKLSFEMSSFRFKRCFSNTRPRNPKLPSLCLWPRGPEHIPTLSMSFFLRHSFSAWME